LRAGWPRGITPLERIGIACETPEGIADFHAAGRHSHITGLVRHGATLVDAKELARHADVRQTMKYTHIGLEDQAEALAGLMPVSHKPPLIGCALAALRAAFGVTGCRWMSAAASDVKGARTNKPRRGRGLRRLLSQAVAS
jgi:hypothetical protein